MDYQLKRRGDRADSGEDQCWYSTGMLTTSTLTTAPSWLAQGLFHFQIGVEKTLKHNLASWRNRAVLRNFIR